MERGILKIAHRGASGYEPENTILAFKKAIELGADAVEFDVRRCKDGNLVVIHDYTVDRTTNGQGFVKNFTLEELKRFDAGKNQRIPTLEEAIDFLRRKVIIGIEVKEVGIERDVVEMIEKKKIIEKCVVMSFYHPVIKNIRELNPKIKTGIISWTPFFLIRDGNNLGCEILIPFFVLVRRSFVKKAHENGKRVATWLVNNPKYIEKMKEIGVDAIASNYPDRL